MKKWLFMVGLVFCLGFQTFAQNKYLDNASQVLYDQQKNLAPIYIAFQEAKAPNFKVSPQYLNDILGINDADITAKLINSDKDDLGFTHYRYQEIYRGLPIEGAVYIVHVKAGKALSLNGQWLNEKSLASQAANLKVVLSEAAALQSALAHVNAKTYKWALPDEEKLLKSEMGDDKATYFPKGEKVYVSNASGEWDKTPLRLAFKFNVYAHEPLSKRWIFVDAETGNILMENNQIQDADVVGTAVTAYSGTKPITMDSYAGSYRLREAGRGLGVETYNLQNGTNYGTAVDFTNSTTTWNLSGSDKYALDAHFGAEMTYDYLKNVHNRNSINNAGFKIKSYVHFSYNFVNAFWNGTCMTYGDGSGTITALTPLDVVGHEITHGLTSFTANLNYSYEPGALNESFSDIFGTVIEFYANPTTFTPNWTIGERMNFIIRDMSNPNAKNHPDTYLGTFWYTGAGDYGGVHSNSGVQNYWFYLLTMGGNGTNDIGNAFCVQGIGMDKAAKIAFRTLTVYLTPTSNYSNARTASIQAAVDLYGANSDEVAQVTSAWYAVGVGAQYSGKVILNNINASGTKTYKYNNPLTVSNFTVVSSSNISITSAISVQILPNTLLRPKTFVSIAPGCMGGAFTESSTRSN